MSRYDDEHDPYAASGDHDPWAEPQPEAYPGSYPEPDRGPRPPAGPPLGRGGPRTGPRHGRPDGRRPGRAGGGGSGRSRGPRIALGIAVVGLLLIGSCGVWVQRQVNPPGSPGAVRTVTVPPGATSGSIGKLLESEGIISSSSIWDWYLRIKGGGPFEAGDYELAEDSSMGDVVRIMDDGPKPPEEKRFTVPEGFTVRQTLDRLADATKGLGFDRATLQQLVDGGQIRSAYQPAGSTSSEGIFFPDTYEVERDATPQQVLELMVSQLDTTMGDLQVESAQQTFHLTPYEILITASLIEEETKVPEERAMVARVIYNRLKQGIPLGIDATSRYEAEITRGDRSKVDFTSTSPYNTRKVKGLPPTPIASPGKASIEAALHPADGPWTYYVLKDAQGHHTFTDSPSEFAAAKRRCHDAGLGCG